MGKINLKSLIINVAIPLAVGGLSYWVTKDNMNVFDMIVKPPLTPPAVVFPIVWTILFVLMGIAAYIVCAKESALMYVYFAQLAVNFLWSVVFFNFQAYFIAFLVIIVLWSLIFSNIRWFREVSKAASYMLYPYLAWVTFAAYLNIAIVFLNH